MKRIKNDYSLLKHAVFGTLTMGIYAFYLFYRLANDVNVLCRDTGRKTTSAWVYLLLSLVTCGAYAIFWWYRIGDMLARQVRTRDLHSDITGGYVMISFILGYFLTPMVSWVGLYKVYTTVNELADDYNANVLPTLAAQQQTQE